MALDIEPAEGMVALQILDDVDNDMEEDERTGAYDPGGDSYNEALIAIVAGVGKKVTNCKKGDTVFVRSYARNGIKVGDGTVICESYVVVAKVA